MAPVQDITQWQRHKPPAGKAKLSKTAGVMLPPGCKAKLSKRPPGRIAWIDVALENLPCCRPRARRLRRKDRQGGVPG